LQKITNKTKIRIKKKENTSLKKGGKEKVGRQDLSNSAMEGDIW